MTIPKAPPPLEKDVRRRLDLVGDSCSHLSKREQITVMGFDAIGQNKDGFSMKKCHKNSKVVFFHIYVVHCCYMNLSFHTDWWFLLVQFFCSCFTPRFVLHMLTSDLQVDVSTQQQLSMQDDWRQRWLDLESTEIFGAFLPPKRCL